MTKANRQLKPSENWFKGGKILLFIQILFVSSISLTLIYKGFFPSLELLFTLVVALLIWKSKTRALLYDLLPFLLLLISFQSLRGFADDLSPSSIHIVDLIEYEKYLFKGIIPAAFIQNHLLNQPYSFFIEMLTSVFYWSHFVTPVITAMFLWHYKKTAYWPFVIGLILLSYIAFITYILYPAAPPWWATEFGYLTDQPVIIPDSAMKIVITIAGPNPVAAMPSLHIAYPIYISLFCIYIWGKRTSWIFILPIAVGFSTLYLGHHYVLDLFVGIAYALVIFIGISIFIKFQNALPIRT